MSQEDKEALFGVLGAISQTNARPGVMVYLLISLIEAASKDLRLVRQFSQSQAFVGFYRRANDVCSQQQDSQNLYHHFVAIYSRYAQPSDEIYSSAYQIFVDQMKLIPEQGISKEKVDFYVLKFMFINQFLRNEWFLVSYFTTESSKLNYDAFYRGTASIHENTIKPLLSIY